MKSDPTSGGVAPRPLALVAAGGEGRRLGSIGPKALVSCAGRPLLAWCLEGFRHSAAFGNGAGLVVVAGHASDLASFEAACAPAREGGLDVIVVQGGRTRSHSVAEALRAGLAALGEAGPGEAGPVLVQDAARIFSGPDLIDSIVTELAAAPSELAGLVAASPVSDTIKLVDENGIVRETPPRERLWAAQTPQVFRRAALAEALGLTGDASDDEIGRATDDASIVEARGGQVRIFEWTAPNGKITTPPDLAAAEAQLSRSDP